MGDEYVDVVDEDDKVVGRATRNESDEKSLRRRGSRVLIFNSKGNVLLQKRSRSKKQHPGCWDFGIAETVKAGEGYEEAAIRGLKEELNIDAESKNIDFEFKLRYTNGKTKRHYHIFSLNYDGGISIDESELEEAKFVSRKGLREIMKREKFVPAALKVFEEYERLGAVR